MAESSASGGARAGQNTPNIQAPSKGMGPTEALVHTDGTAASGAGIQLGVDVGHHNSPYLLTLNTGPVAEQDWVEALQATGNEAPSVSALLRKGSESKQS